MSNKTGNAGHVLDENTRRYYLDVMGVQCWQLRDNEKPPVTVDAASAAGSAAQSNLAIKAADSKPAADLPANDWTLLQSSVQQCHSCMLHDGRKQAILGRGNQAAQLMFVLLAPDSNDDNAARLCSGEAEALFARMLSAINLSMDEVYITSLLKCCVPARHTVTPQQIQHCNKHLKRQVELMQPKLLVVLGETTIRCLLQENMSLDDYRLLNAEASYHFDSVPIFASYSPQELLLQAGNKRKAWADLQQLQKVIESG